MSLKPLYGKKEKLREYGGINHYGKRLHYIAHPQPCASNGRGDALRYCAPAVDPEGNKYTVSWPVVAGRARDPYEDYDVDYDVLDWDDYTIDGPHADGDQNSPREQRKSKKLSAEDWHSITDTIRNARAALQQAMDQLGEAEYTGHFEADYTDNHCRTAINRIYQLIRDTDAMRDDLEKLSPLPDIFREIFGLEE